jgi:hypothetical protein
MHSQIKVLRNYNFAGGLFSMLSGVMIVADPVVSRLVGNAVADADKRNMIKAGLPQVWENADKLETDYTRFHNFCINHQVKDRPELAALVARVEAYDANHAYCVSEIQRNASELRRGNRTAVQNMGTGALVGSTKIAAGIMTMHCGHNYIHDGNRTNTNLFIANLVYLPGVTWGLLDNIRIQTQREFRQQQLKKEGKLPGQIIQARLDQLNSIEKKI